MNYYMTKYNVVMCCYDKVLVNVAAYLFPLANQEFHMRPHLPKFYHNNTLL